MIMEFMMFMIKAIILCYPVYLTGSLGLSISWILLSILMWTMWRNNRRWKDRRIDTAIDFLENEKDVINTELKSMNMPAWVRGLLDFFNNMSWDNSNFKCSLQNIHL